MHIHSAIAESKNLQTKYCLSLLICIANVALQCNDYVLKLFITGQKKYDKEKLRYVLERHIDNDIETGRWIDRVTGFQKTERQCDGDTERQREKEKKRQRDRDAER